MFIETDSSLVGRPATATDESTIVSRGLFRDILLADAAAASCCADNAVDASFAAEPALGTALRNLIKLPRNYDAVVSIAFTVHWVDLIVFTRNHLLQFQQTRIKRKFSL